MAALHLIALIVAVLLLAYLLGALLRPAEHRKLGPVLVATGI